MRQDGMCMETVIFRLMRMGERTSRESFDLLLACQPMWGGFILNGSLASWLKGQGFMEQEDDNRCILGATVFTHLNVSFTPLILAATL